MKSRTRTLIKLDAVLARIPISRPTLDRLEARGEFPPRRRIGRSVFWDASEVDAYLKNLPAEQHVSYNPQETERPDRRANARSGLKDGIEYFIYYFKFLP